MYSLELFGCVRLVGVLYADVSGAMPHVHDIRRLISNHAALNALACHDGFECAPGIYILMNAP